MAAIVGIISRHGLTIEPSHRSQPNKSKLALYKPWIWLKEELAWATDKQIQVISNIMPVMPLTKDKK